MNRRVSPGLLAVVLYFSAHYCALAQQWTLVRVPVEDNQVLDPDGSGWQFSSVACSADGFRMVAVGSGNLSGAPICVSSDGGLTWRATSAPLNYWTTVVSSTNGLRLAASGSDGIYTSSDGGTNWVHSATFQAALACSADGLRLIAVKAPESSGSSNPASIYISPNGGGTWVAPDSPAATNRWRAVAASADGTKLVAVGTSATPGQTDIYVSRDGGSTWLPVGLPQPAWQNVVSSADGRRLVAVAVFPNKLYTSADGGGTWTLQSGAPSEAWAALASSADGTNLVAGGGLGAHGQIYTSSDAGVTWNSTNDPPKLAGQPVGWLAAASSADGRRLVAAPAAITGLFILQHPTVELAALEVTQVIQDWSNSVFLVADKETYVRAHLQLPKTNSGPVLVNGARLYGTGSSGPLPGSPLSPLNPAGALTVVNITNAASPAVRGEFASSLNFRLPPAWTAAGSLSLQLVWTNNGGRLLPVNVVPTNATVSVDFTEEPTPLLTLFAFTWTNSAVKRVTTPAQMIDARKRMLACYPVARIDAGPVRPYNWQNNGLPDLAMALVRLKCQQLMDAHSSPTVINRIYFGGIYATTADHPHPFGLGNIPGTSSAGFLLGTYGDTRQTPPHEVGHNLNRYHDANAALFDTNTNGEALGACGEVAPVDFDYPLFQPVQGVLRPTLGPMTNGVNAMVYGLDTLTLKQNPALNPVLDPNLYFDLMGYCRGGPFHGPTLPLERWPSVVTYADLLTGIQNAFGPQATPFIGGGTFVLARGVVDLVAGTASFLPFITVDLATTPPGPRAGTNFVLEVLDANGGVLQKVPFDPDLSQDEEDDTAVQGDFIIPLNVNPAFHTARLLYGGQQWASITASTPPPAFTVLSPAGGQTFASGPVTVDWPAVAGAVSYVVQYSPDNGQSWQVLGLDWPAPPFTVDSAQLAASTTALVRVLANDGFNTTAAQSIAPFIIPPHPPELIINTPLEGAIYSVDQQVFLDVEASDMQDGDLSGSSVEWRSDLDGPLGQGTVLNFPASRLRQGYHTITATAVDSKGLTNVAVVHIFALVQPPPRLSLVESGGQAYVFWPSSYTNEYVLQTSVDLSAWSSVTDTPTIVGDQQGFPLGVLSGGPRFFRLVFKP